MEKISAVDAPCHRSQMVALFALALLALAATPRLLAQSLGNAGTIEGTVLDASGAAVPNATVTIHNPITNYRQSTTSDASGSFRLFNLPPHPYHLQVTAPSFSPYVQDVTVRSSVPIKVTAKLAVASEKQTVTV